MTTEDITKNNQCQLIDIDKVIRDKSPRLAKSLPKFIKNYLKRILHEDSINELIRDNQNYYGMDFIYKILNHFGARVKVHGLNNIKSDKKLLIAANHPLGGLDGIVIISAVGLHTRNIIFPVNDILLHVQNLKELFIPINKHGNNPKGAVKMLEEMMSSDKTVLYFPAGLVSRKRKGKISDLDWKKTFIQKAKKHNRIIVPTFIDGENSSFFYNLANWRRFLRIKANIEMLYLVDEMYKQYNKDINIYFGKPLLWDDLPQNLNDFELANHIKSISYNLPNLMKNEEPIVISSVKSEEVQK